MLADYVLVLTNLQLSASGLYYSLHATNNVSPYVNNSSWLQLNIVPLTPMVQLIATNYDGNSVWTDSSGISPRRPITCAARIVSHASAHGFI